MVSNFVRRDFQTTQPYVGFNLIRGQLISHSAIVVLDVFNSNGYLVYKNANYQSDWNGICNQNFIGKDTPDRNYLYIISNEQ